MIVNIDDIKYKPESFCNNINVLVLSKIPHPLNNFVIVKPYLDYSKTNSGIIIPPEYLDEYQHSVRCSVVVRNPDKLVPIDKVTIDKAHPSLPTFMEWECDIETIEGDIIIHDYLDSMNAQKFVVNGDNTVYYMIPYSGIYLIIRGNDVIVPNGYVILEDIFIKKRYLNYEKEEIDTKFAIVKYVGKPVKRYYNKLFDCGIVDVKAGDKVLIDKKYSLSYVDKITGEKRMRRIYLEVSYHSFLKENLFRVKRNEILAIIE